MSVITGLLGGIFVLLVIIHSLLKDIVDILNKWDKEDK